MIRLVEIRQWRAYDHVVIDLHAPVVFFVAPNGVGKSSFVEATRWALLGTPVPRKAARAVRQGTDQASVTVEVDIGEGAPIRVTRTLTPAGRSTFSARRGDEAISEQTYDRLLRAEWGADRPVIDNLMFTDPETPVAKSAFPVREHLADVLGVTPLLRAADELGAHRKGVEAQIVALREEVTAIETELANLDQAATDTADDVQAVIAERDRLVELIEAEEERNALAQEWVRFRAAADDHNTRLAELLAEIATVVEVDPNEPGASIESATNEATQALTEATDAKTDRELQSARSSNAADLLAEPTEVCPTCLRPLADHERLAALNRHGAAVSSDDERVEAGAAVDAADAHLARLRDFGRRLVALQPPQPPATDDPGPEVAATLASLRANHLEVVERVGALQATATSEQARQRLTDDLAQVQRRLNHTASEELMAATTIDMLNDLADRTLTDRIDPLIAELSARWKTVFGADGLTLEPSGQLVVRSQEGTLEVSDLSGGERATAMLIARLLITASTTSIPTVWFDEPLEHLDPRRRAAVAKTLVRAGQTQTVDQLIITTYEERIARQLAAADPDNVRIVHADKPRPT